MKLVGPFSQILTMENLPLRGSLSDDDLVIISNGGVLIDGEKIIKIGKFNDIRKEASETFQIKSPQVLLPGFIDSHTHLCYDGDRSIEFSKRNSGVSYQKILDEGGGIHNTMRSTAKASQDELINYTSSRLDRHFREGVLTCEIKSGYGDSIENELKLLRTINEIGKVHPTDVIPTCLAAHVKPKKFTSNKLYLDAVINDLIPVIRKEKLSSRIDIFTEKNAFNIQESTNYLNKLMNDFDLTLHANQFTSGAVKVGVDLGAVSVDHLEVMSDDEIDYLSKSQTCGVVLPGCSIGLGLPFAPARKMLDKNCLISIATDWNPGSAPMGDLLTQSSIIASYEKLTSAEIFSAITFRAANSLGINDRGRISPSMLADFISFETSDFREILYHQGKMKPTLICKRGEIYN